MRASWPPPTTPKVFTTPYCPMPTREARNRSSSRVSFLAFGTRGITRSTPNSRCRWIFPARFNLAKNPRCKLTPVNSPHEAVCCLVPNKPVRTTTRLLESTLRLLRYRSEGISQKKKTPDAIPTNRICCCNASVKRLDKKIYRAELTASKIKGRRSSPELDLTIAYCSSAKLEFTVFIVASARCQRLQRHEFQLDSPLQSVTGLGYPIQLPFRQRRFHPVARPKPLNQQLS